MSEENKDGDQHDEMSDGDEGRDQHGEMPDEDKGRDQHGSGSSGNLPHDPESHIPNPKIVLLGAFLVALGIGVAVKKCSSTDDSSGQKAPEAKAISSDRVSDAASDSSLSDILVEVEDAFRDTLNDNNDLLSDEPLDPLSLAKFQFGEIPGISESQIEDSYLAISSALEEIENNSDLKNLLDEYGIVLESPAYYMAIALKESSLKSDTVSSSGRRGYFQLTTTPGSALEDVSKFFDVDFTDEDVFYAGDDDSLSLLAAKNNSLGGILYWHLCRDIYLSKGFNPQIPEEDRERATAFAYNMGISDFRFLWNELKPSSFFDFGIIISGFLTQPQMKNRERANGEESFDSVYGLNRVTYVRAVGDQDQKETIQIGGKSFRAAKLLQALKYAETVYGLMAFERQYPDHFTIRPGFRMWSIADRVIDICVENYEIPYFVSSGRTKTQKIKTLYYILVAFNAQTNASFENVNPSNPDIEEGTDVLVPDKAYIENYLSMVGDGDGEYPTSTTNVAVETLPKNVPLYADDVDGKLAEEGSKILEYNEKNPPKVIVPKVKKGRKKVPLNTGKASIHTDKNSSGAMSYIVLHSTMGSPVGLYRTQKIHYIVRRDGTIEQISDENIPRNHSGYQAKAKTPAMWNGDGNISFKSIGIEVETPSKGNGDVSLWTDQQYEAVKNLVHWIGSRHKMPAAHVLTHSQVAYSKWGRGRKPDPHNLDWEKLDLPNNYLRVDPDVAGGKIESNLKWILSDIKKTGADWHGCSEDMLSGLKAAEKIFKKGSAPSAAPSTKAPRALPKKDAVLKAKSKSAPVAAGGGKRRR